MDPNESTTSARRRRVAIVAGEHYMSEAKLGVFDDLVDLTERPLRQGVCYS